MALERPIPVTVLIVDDEDTTRHLCRDVVAESGLRTRLASTTEQALEILEQYPVDIVLTDIRVQQLGGRRQAVLVLIDDRDRAAVGREPLRDGIDELIRALHTSGFGGDLVPDFVEVALRGSGDAQPFHLAPDLARSAARRLRPRDFTRSASLWMVFAS